MKLFKLIKTYDERTLRIRTASQFEKKVKSMVTAVQQFNIYRVFSSRSRFHVRETGQGAYRNRSVIVGGMQIHTVDF